MDGARHDVPAGLNWIQVWGTGGPFQSINAFLLQELLTHSSHMRSCIRRNPTAPAYGLTRGLRISSRYLMVVRLPLASTWRAVRPPKEMPPHTMTDPPPNRSCWRMLQAAERSPRRLQTLSRLSHVLSVNLLSSVKSTGRQWRICQSAEPLLYWGCLANCL